MQNILQSERCQDGDGMALEVRSEFPSSRDKGQGEFLQLAVSCLCVEQGLAHVVDG